jgi:DNA invertase Pin-like site-specific DNA recombinase
MGLRTVVYLRKSSKDQDENTGEFKQKYSLERQELEINNYFEKFIDTETDEEKKLIWKRKLNVDYFREDASSKTPG